MDFETNTSTFILQVLFAVVMLAVALSIFFDYHKKKDFKKSLYFVLFMTAGVLLAITLWNLIGLYAIITVPFLLAGFIFLSRAPKLQKETL